MTRTPEQCLAVHVDRIRAHAANYRRKADFISRRSWWMRLFRIHPDYRLIADLRKTAAKLDTKADRAERGFTDDI